MADHHPALRQSRVDLAQPVGDVGVGEAVKAVAAHTLLVPAVRDREPVGDLGMAAMERGVEARDLGHLRPARADLADRRQIVRLVQRRQGHQPLEPLQHRVVHQDRRVEIRAAMDDPVADRARGAAEPAEEPRLDPVQCRAHVRYLARRVRLVGQHRAGGVLGGEMRLGADALELTPERQPEPVGRGDVEELELDARRAGVDHQQRAARARHGAATAAAASRRAWA